jgi:hypothetical protein
VALTEVPSGQSIAVFDIGIPAQSAAEQLPPSAPASLAPDPPETTLPVHAPPPTHIAIPASMADVEWRSAPT